MIGYAGSYKTFRHFLNKIPTGRSEMTSWFIFIKAEEKKMSKFSVKKPYTVLVAVIMVIVLGIVSFMKMSADLLPSINLPYVITIT